MGSFGILIVLISLSSCLAVPSRVPRIIGGGSAEENQFPFVASIRTFDFDNFYHDCGAAIISERVLLTAAHCIRQDPESYRVSVGAHNRKEDGVVHTVKKLILHPDYDDSITSNDVGLIILNESIKFSKNVTTVEINKDAILHTEPATYAGWGMSGDGNTNLKYIDLEILTHEQCRYMVPENEVDDSITFCALGGADSGLCIGDSGGPLIHNNKVIGISTWFSCTEGIPEGFARASAYIEWIDTISKQELNVQ